MKRSLRVAYVLTPITFGGAEKVSLNFLSNVDRKQIDLHVIALVRPWEEPPLLLDDFDDGVVTRWLGGELRGLSQHFRRIEPRIACLRDFFWQKRRASRYDDFSWADPLPLAVWRLDSLIRLWKYKKQQPHEYLDGVGE